MVLEVVVAAIALGGGGKATAILVCRKVSRILNLQPIVPI